MLQKLGKIHIIRSYGLLFLLLGSFFVSINNKDLASVEFKGQFELKGDHKTIIKSFENLKTFNFKTKSYYRDSLSLSVPGEKNTHITVYRLTYIINNNTIYLVDLHVIVILGDDMSTWEDILYFKKPIYRVTLAMKSIYECPKPIIIDNLKASERQIEYSLKLTFNYIKFIPNIEKIPQTQRPLDSDTITQQLEKEASKKITTKETSETTVKPVINHDIPIPEPEENPSEIDLPVTEEKSSAIDLLAHEEQSIAIDQPVTEGKSSAIDLPASEEKAGEIDLPVTEEQSRAINLPASEEKSGAIDLLAPEEKPGQIHQPVTREKSSVIDQVVTEEKFSVIDDPEIVAEHDLEKSVIKTEISQDYQNEDQIELSAKTQKIQNIEQEKNEGIVETIEKIVTNTVAKKSQILKVADTSSKSGSTNEKFIKGNSQATENIENPKPTSSIKAVNKIIEKSTEGDVIEKSIEVDHPKTVAELDFEEMIIKTEIPQDSINEGQIEFSSKPKKIKDINDKKNAGTIGNIEKIVTSAVAKISQILKVVEISSKSESPNEKSIKVNSQATENIANPELTSSTTAVNKIIQNGKDRNVVEKLHEDKQPENYQTIDDVQKAEVGTKTEKSTTQNSEDMPKITLESDYIPIIGSTEIREITRRKNGLDKNESLTILENNKTTLTDVFISSTQVVAKDVEAKHEIINSKISINEKSPLTQIFVFMSILVAILVSIIFMAIKKYKKRVTKMERKQKLLEY